MCSEVFNKSAGSPGYWGLTHYIVVICALWVNYIIHWHWYLIQMQMHLHNDLVENLIKLLLLDRLFDNEINGGIDIHIADSCLRHSHLFPQSWCLLYMLI